jgi:hypothetical protein
MSSVELGTTRRRKKVVLDAETRARHMQVIGASQRGKSRFLEEMIRQDINAGRGLCLIDPHGTLYDRIVQWCATHRMNKRRRIHLMNPAAQDWTIGYNPLRRTEFDEPAVRVDAMVKACALVWNEDSTRTPLLRKWLRAVFYTLMVKELTLLEAKDLTTANDPVGLRRFLTHDIPDPIFRSVWEDFFESSPRDRADQFSSTINRMLEFLGSPVLRNIIGQRERVLDVRQCMDQGEIVLVNLALKGKLSPANARLLGMLLVNDFVGTAYGRDEATAKRRPFYLYIDECYDYLNEDTERMLDQTAKFGLHLILAHQRLGQLKTAGDSIYNAVMTGAQTKVVFGLEHDEDAEAMAKQIFRTEFDLEQPKHILDKPVTVGYRIEWLRGESEGFTEGESWGESESAGSGTSAANSAGSSDQGRWPADTMFLTPSPGTGDNPALGWVTNEGSSAGSSEHSSASRSNSGNFSRSNASSRHQTLVPILEERATQLKSFNEVVHEAIVRLRNLPPRRAIVKTPIRRSVEIQTFTVNPGFASSRRVAEFTNEVLEQGAYTSPVPLIEQEITNRQNELQALAREHQRRPPAPALKDKGWS